VARAVWFLALLGLVAAPGVSATDPARAFLSAAFSLSTAEIAQVDRGQIVTRTLAVQNAREVATLGVVRVGTTPEHYVEQLRDIATFKRTADILQIGTFTAVPVESDLEPLTIEDADLKRLRECRAGDCALRFSADGIERIQREIDWRTADASPQASRLLRRLLVDYVAGYQLRGGAAAMEYAGTSAPPFSVDLDHCRESGTRMAGSGDPPKIAATTQAGSGATLETTQLRGADEDPARDRRLRVFSGGREGGDHTVRVRGHGGAGAARGRLAGRTTCVDGVRRRLGGRRPRPRPA